jgi:lipopolysaccharide export system permease protein
MGLVSKEYLLIEDPGPAIRSSRYGAPSALRRAPADFFISRSYASWITAQVVLYFLLLAALFEGLFLSQHFIDIFNANADEVGSLTDALILVVLSAPEIHYVLPVALLTAAYFVVLRCRERRELIVFAGAGLGVQQFTVLAFLWGLAALAASLLITGVVLPHTRFAFRTDLFAFRNEALAAGGAPGHFYSFPRYTVFKWPGDATGDCALFIYQTRENNLDRAISINNAEVTKSARRDALDLRFGKVVALDVPSPISRPEDIRMDLASKLGDCPGCSQAQDRVTRVENYAQTFDLEQLSHLDPRGIDPREWTTLELVGISQSPTDGVSNEALREELTDRLVRGLLALTAPFFALLAIGWTTRLTQGFALPIACATVLGIDVIGVTVSRTLALGGTPLAMAGVSGIFATILAVALWQIGALQPALVTPALSKA